MRCRSLSQTRPALPISVTRLSGHTQLRRRKECARVAGAQVREAVGLPAIQTAERALTEQMHAALKARLEIEILGPPLGGADKDDPYPGRLPLVSLMVRAPAWGGRSRYLHYSFVCALLNDVFGVQVRLRQTRCIFETFAATWFQYRLMGDLRLRRVFVLGLDVALPFEIRSDDFPFLESRI